MIHEYFIQEFTWFFIYIIVVISFNLAVGFTGLVNLGHMVFFGIGAYASALLTLNGVPWYISIILAGILAAAFGTIIAAITVRLKGDYFQIVTLGLVFIAIAVSRNWVSLTRGALGLPGVPEIIKNNFHYMLFAFGISSACVIFFYWLTKTYTGKIFQAIRDDETATAVLGKNTYFYKILSIAISTFFAGIAGSLYVHFINFVDPTIFDLESFVIVLSMLIAGGLASVTGSIIGTFLMFVVIDSLRFVIVIPELIGPVRQILLMVILILVLIFRPKGILGKVDV